MKLIDRFIEDHANKKVIHQRVFDIDPTIARAKALRERQDTHDAFNSDSKHLATVPTWLINEWAKEAGVRWDDPALKQVIARKLNSGEFDSLKVWDGKHKL